MWRWVKEDLKPEESFEDQSDFINSICSRLLEGEPIQYITGRSYFYGLELKVSPAVLIPRPETEELVYHALKSLKQGQRVLDIGTGSGCIAIALKHKVPELDVWACDVSLDALSVAEHNAKKYNLPITTFEANLSEISSFERLPQFDMIISNPPYIQLNEKQQMTSNTRFEPDIALFSPEDALWAYRHILKIAERKLIMGGLVFFELNEFRAKDISSLVSSSEFEKLEIIQDLQGKPRILKVIKT